MRAGGRWRSRLFLRRERRAHRLLLGRPERLKHGEAPPYVLLGPLQAHRHRDRTPTVRGCCRELREAERVPRVPEYRAAPGPVPEERHPGGVCPGSGRLRPGGRYPAPLLLPQLAAEEPATDVAPDEPVQIRRRRDDPSRCP